MAVTVFKLVSVSWVFTAVLTIFQLIILLREQVQSGFSTKTAVRHRAVSWPEAHCTDWFTVRKTVYEWHIRLGWEEVFTSFIVRNTNLHSCLEVFSP